MSAHDLSAVFPPSPTSVPPGLTTPSASYKRHAWLALGGLLTFVGLYLGLTGYLGWSVWRLVGSALLHGGNVIGATLLSLPALFFLAFLLRGLFVVKHGADPSLVELHPKDQPTLFAFLHRLADETGAPRPHRVFLSSRVNAAVFYDLSFWNLLFPSKKNLELGLGLVNVLSLDELKAVLAHEYGHFAQRTMAVGRWVYLAQQIAGHIVMSRGVFDRFLAGLSRIDLRVAWIGWILRLFVWAIRAVLDTAFRLVVLAHRALGREMEFNADRVAVSVSGSDSLVHALHKLGPADEAWEEAVSFAADELHARRDVEDLFVLQTAALAHLRRIFDEPGFGATPPRPANGAAHRVFTEGLAQPPRMWMTHPPSRDREESAKAVYLPSALDERSAWLLFQDEPGLRRRVTAQLFAKAVEEREKNSAGKPAPQPPTSTVEERFALRFARAALDPKYRGVYLGRSLAAYEATPEALIGRVESLDEHGVLAALDALYPASLRSELKAYRERREEELQLQGLADGVLTAPGGTIRYRGREIRRKELRGVIDAVKTERRDVEQRILDHDKSCRATHLAAARLVGHGWAEHLTGLVELLHFSAHCHRDLGDAYGHLHHVLDIVLADGNVSNAERQRVLQSAHDVFSLTVRLWQLKPQLGLPDDVDAIYAGAGGFSALSEDLGLLAPSDANLGDWLKVMEGWVQGALGDLRVLSDVTLDRLLEVEARVASWVRDGGEVTDAPSPAVVPRGYQTCVVGQERARQKKLGWWDRFQTADGVVPGTLRAAVASGVLLPALFVGGHIGSATVHAVNGLNVPVKVKLGDRVHVLPATSAEAWEVEPSSDLKVVTTTLDGTPIEAFDVSIGGGFSHALYDVAHSSALVEWTAIYGAGSGKDLPDMPRGAPRWADAPQDYLFTDPPRSMSLKAGQTAYKRVLVAAHRSPPAGQLSLVSAPDEKAALVLAHVRYDDLDARYGAWADLADQWPETKAALLERAQREPRNVYLQRVAEDLLPEKERQARCVDLERRAAEAPDDADLAYLSLRCNERSSELDGMKAAWEKHRDHPWLNWAMVDVLAAQGRWKDALHALEVCFPAKGFEPMEQMVSLEYLRVARGAQAAGLEVRLPRALTTPAPGTLAEFVHRIEGAAGKDDTPIVAAYRALNRGALDEVERSGQGKKELTLLLGASDGASSAQVDAARAAGGHGDLAWVAEGLALRAGAPVEAITLPGVPAETTRALAQALATRNVAAVDAVARRLGLYWRGVAFALGAIVLQEKAPKHWRAEARALLLPYERPFFR